VTDLFAAQSAIVTRLQAQIADVTAYYGSQAAGANSQGLAMPCVIVAPGPSEVPNAAHSDEGGAVWENHSWRVGVRVSMDTGATAAARAEPLAGTLAYAVIQALKGWSPGSGYSVLRYLGREALQYETEAGYAEVWISFNSVSAIA